MTPFPFQRECLNELDWFDGRAGLFLDPGLGKTPVSLWHLLRHERDALPAVVVCPASVKYHWEKIATEFGLRCLVTEGYARPDFSHVPDLVVVGWSGLAGRRGRKGHRSWPGQVEWLPSIRPRAVVVDECQYGMSGSSRAGKALARLCRGVGRIVALSGTPLVNRPIELWPTLRLLRPDVFVSRFDYARKFCGAKLTPWGWDFRGASNLDELHALLDRTCMVRRRKAEVLPDLPEKVRSIVPLPLSDPDEYERAEEDFAGWLADTQEEGQVKRALRAEAFTRVGYLLRLAARLKLPAVAGWVAEWLDTHDGKLVLFARHRAVLDHLQRDERIDRLSAVARIDGGVTGRARQHEVDRFRDNRGTRLLLGNMQAAGTGLDGLQVAEDAANAELGWTPGGHVQAEDRLWRIGQAGHVWIHYLVARGTIETDMCERLQRKAGVLSRTLDGGVRDDDLDLLDMLTGSLLKRRA